MSRLWRVHHPTIAAPGSGIILEAAETRHLTRVLRLGPGDAISVFDGRGREWRGVIERVEDSRAHVRVEAEITDPVEPGLAVVLFQGLCRTERMDWVVQKATEIGVAGIRAFATERSEVGRPTERRLGRWKRIAAEACKQSGRRAIPAVEVLPGLPGARPEGVRGFVLGRGPRSRALGEYTTGPAPAAVWLAVGPEGGLARAEIDALLALGWEEASLGPRTLRTETAGIVASALVLRAWGDLGRPAAGSG